MKIFVALFYPLIASLLLLPSYGGAQRDNSKDATVPTGDEYFTPENLAKTCKVCSMFNVDQGDCLSNANGEARKHCREMVFEMSNRVEKQWKKLSVKSPTLPIGEEYFTPENLAKTCKICNTFKVDSYDCLANANGEARKNCREKVFEMSFAVAKQWIIMSGKNTMVSTGEVYFTPENLAKTCKICNIFKIDSYDCLANAYGEARKKCREMVFEMSNIVAKQWKKLSGKKRTPAVEKDLPALPGPVPARVY